MKFLINIILTLSAIVSHAQSYKVPTSVHDAAKEFTEYLYAGEYDSCLNNFKLNKKEVGYLLHNVESDIIHCKQNRGCTIISDFTFEPLKATLKTFEEVDVYTIYFKRTEEYYTTITLIHFNDEVEIGSITTYAHKSNREISKLDQ